jgi:hypothetical protein
MKGLIVRLLLPIPSGRSSKEFTNWLFYREGKIRRQARVKDSRLPVRLLVEIAVVLAVCRKKGKSASGSTG